MNFFNIGGGEILVIILLALLLFGPKDIMNIMRTVGKYTRAASRTWAQLTAGLQGDLLPDEVQDVVDETKASFAEVGDTLKKVSTVVKETETSVKEEGKAIDQSLQVTIPNARAEVQAEIRQRKAARADKAADVQGILAVVGKTAPASQSRPKAAPPPAPTPADQTVASQSGALTTDNVPASDAAPPATDVAAIATLLAETAPQTDASASTPSEGQ